MKKMKLLYLGIIIMVLGICFIGIGCRSISEIFSEDNSQEVSENERLKGKFGFEVFFGFSF